MYDTIVVGAGIEGSAAAYYLAKNKQNTLLLEQFPLPHSRGSSHGQSRAIRYSYKDRVYASMMAEAYAMWHQLEAETDTTLYVQTGMLVLQESDHGGTIDDRIKNNRDLDQAITELSADEINKKYAGVHYWNSYRGFIEHKAGVLIANKSLLAFQNQFVKFGGKIRDREKVTKIIPGSVVTVETNKGQYRAKRIILTVGPWASEVLRPLGLNPPLKTWRMNVCYWKEKILGTFAGFPVFQELACTRRYMLPGRKLPRNSGVLYGLPSIEYPGMIKTWCMNVCYWKEKKPGTYANFPVFAELACNDRYILPGHKYPGHICVVYGLPIIEYPGMMKTWRMNVCYWKEKILGTFAGFPVFQELACTRRYMLPGRKLPRNSGVLYGLPSIEYPGMIKIAYHTGNESVLPDDRDKVARGEQRDIKMLQKYVRDHFPGLEDEPAIVEHCMYTKTPDEHPILDKHPAYPNIVLGIGMSGHGFKLAPVFGKVLYELAMGQTPSYDLQMFSAKRFDDLDRLSSKL